MTKDTNKDEPEGAMKEPPKLSSVPAPEPEPPANGKAAKLYTLDNMPPVLLKQRAQIRKMMDLRCAQPGSPIPPSLSARAADFIMMLVMLRARARVKAGKKPFPSTELMHEDIARAAEGTEIVIEQMVLEAIESIKEAPSIITR